MIKPGFTTTLNSALTPSRECIMHDSMVGSKRLCLMHNTMAKLPAFPEFLVRVVK